ncbi:MAG: AraC family transcriptional regulator [Alphaproteobacteria bacterium]
MHSKYNASECSGEKINEEWGQVISEVYYPMDVEVFDKSNFQAELEAWSFYDVLVTKLYSKGVKYIAKHGQITGKGARDYMMFTFPIDHAVKFVIDNRELISNPGTFFIEQSYSEYEVSHEQVSDLLVIKVPREYIDQKIVIPQHFSAKIMDCSDGFSKVFYNFLVGLHQNYEKLKNSEKYVISGMIVDYIVLMLENNRELIESAQGSISINHLLKIESFVKENISDPDLSPEMVSKHCEISTSYLYKIFAKQDQSFSSWLRNLRLDSCRIDLMNPNDKTPVSDICARWGFVDQSYFSRIFKEKYDVSPLQYRKSQK